MNRLLILLVTAVTLGMTVVSQPTYAARQPTQMSVKLAGLKIKGAGVITFRLAIKGMKLDAAGIGKHPATGHGHVQYYLNKIPADAHRRADTKNLIKSVASSTYTLSRKTSRIKISRGHHIVYIALAKNNNVLYHARPATAPIVMP